MSAKAWFITAARGLGVDIAEDEPSHIHIPRRRRVGRPDDRGTRAAWGSHVSDEERGAASLSHRILLHDRPVPVYTEKARSGEPRGTSRDDQARAWTDNLIPGGA